MSLLLEVALIFWDDYSLLLIRDVVAVFCWLILWICWNRLVVISGISCLDVSSVLVTLIILVILVDGICWRLLIVLVLNSRDRDNWLCEKGKK
jgi:hypothetical protein